MTELPIPGAVAVPGRASPVAPVVPEGRLSNVSGAVLLGGESRRMGRDKAHLMLGGVSLVARVAEALARVCDEVLLVGGAPPEDVPGRRVEDPNLPGDERCALRGLVGAFQAATSERVLVVAVDLACITVPVLAGLIAAPEAGVVAVRADGRLQPLCAVYRRADALAVARRRLEGGLGQGGRQRQRDWTLAALLDELGVGVLEASELAALDPEGVALTNLNSPKDLAQAEARLTAQRVARA